MGGEGESVKPGVSLGKECGEEPIVAPGEVWGDGPELGPELGEPRIRTAPSST